MDHHHHHHHEMDNLSPTPLANGEIESMTGSAHSCHMKMAFYFGTEATVLFEWWKFTTTTGLIYSMVGIFLLATLYEGLKYFREYLFWKSYNAIQYRSVQIPLEKESSNPVSQPTMLSSTHFLQTFLHVIQITISYLLMLIFMTYNIWLCLAVLLGATLGYFLFGWKKSVVVDVTEHCH